MSGKNRMPPPGSFSRVVSQTVAQSASVTAGTNYSLVNDFGRGIIAFFTIHSLPASGSTTAALKIRAVDPVTGGFSNLLAGAARSASGTTVMMVGPGISTSALGVPALLPRDLNLLLSLSTGATSKDVVYSIGIGFTL